MQERLSLKEKVDLIEEYIETTGLKITRETMYKGHQLGVMLVELRSRINMRKMKVEPEILERLERHGLLDSKNGKISDKIDELEKYCKENKRLWLLMGKYTRYPEKKKSFFMKVLKDYNISPVFVCKKTVNEQNDGNERAFDEFKKVARNYEYIRTRHLKKEDYDRLVNAGVGRVFGDNKEAKDIKELSEKTGIPEQKFIEIICAFGSIDAFRKLYIELMKNSVFWKNGQPIFNESFKDNTFLSAFFVSQKQYEIFVEFYKYLEKNEKIVTCFDLSEHNFLARRHSKNFIMTIEDDFVSGKFINEAGLAKFLKDKLTLKELEAILTVISQKDSVSIKGIAKEKIQVSPQRVYQLLKTARNKLKTPDRAESFYEDIDAIQKINFIETYFKYKDIFITLESFEMDNELRNSILNVDCDVSQEIYLTSIEKVGFSANTYNWLKRNNINSIEDIIEKLVLQHESKLFAGFGNAKKLEVEEKLRQVNISVDFNVKKAELKRKPKKKTFSKRTDEKKGANVEPMNDVDYILTISIEELEAAYAELEREEDRYNKLKEKILSILKEKENTKDKRMKEVIASFRWQLDSVESEIKRIKTKKDTIKLRKEQLEEK